MIPDTCRLIAPELVIHLVHLTAYLMTYHVATAAAVAAGDHKPHPAHTHDYARPYTGTRQIHSPCTISYLQCSKLNNHCFPRVHHIYDIMYCLVTGARGTTVFNIPTRSCTSIVRARGEVFALPWCVTPAAFAGCEDTVNGRHITVRVVPYILYLKTIIILSLIAKKKKSRVSSLHLPSWYYVLGLIAPELIPYLVPFTAYLMTVSPRNNSSRQATQESPNITAHIYTLIIVYIARDIVYYWLLVKAESAKNSCQFLVLFCGPFERSGVHASCRAPNSTYQRHGPSHRCCGAGGVFSSRWRCVSAVTQRKVWTPLSKTSSKISF